MAVGHKIQKNIETATVVDKTSDCKTSELLGTPEAEAADRRQKERCIPHCRTGQVETAVVAGSLKERGRMMADEVRSCCRRLMSKAMVSLVVDTVHRWNNSTMNHRTAVVAGNSAGCSSSLGDCRKMKMLIQLSPQLLLK